MIAVVIIICAFFVGSTIGWYLVRREQGATWPFNWRVLIGPWAYYPWLDKKNRDKIKGVTTIGDEY